MKRKADDGLRPLIRKHVPADWQPIENSIVPGVPDLNGCRDGSEVWVECKATTTGSLHFRPLQVPWIHRRSRAGGKVWVVARWRHSGGVRLGSPIDELWVVSGRHVLELAACGLRSLPDDLVAGRWGGGPRGWDWTTLGEILFLSRRTSEKMIASADASG